MEQDSNRLNDLDLKNKALNQSLLKEKAGKAVVDGMVKSGMKLGLGTGSTAIHAVRRVGELLAEGILRDICAFATSFQTEIECEKLRIPFFTLNSRELAGGLDLTIDGADEVDPQNRLIKGGGGALLIEKLAAYNSAAYAIIVDESKLVKNIGSGFPVPVEIIPEARVQVTRELLKLTAGACSSPEASLDKISESVILREAVRKAGPVITEHGNLILDIRFGSQVNSEGKMNPAEMEAEINKIPGVVENGFFTRKPPVVYIARSNGNIEKRD